MDANNFRSKRLKRLLSLIESFPENRLHWVEKVADILVCPHRFVLHINDFISEPWFLSFGDSLMIHHAYSLEPFTKDKFEHALVSTARIVGIQADFAPRGNRGHDIVIKGDKFSLKTQADKNIRVDNIWISKYMELGKGAWSDQPHQLKGLVDAFLDHLSQSDRILILRCLAKSPDWNYELVEIPKSTLKLCQTGELEMKMESKQIPKPGYCSVYDRDDRLIFQLYFDGGSERKLQIKNLNKRYCRVIAEWSFTPNPSSYE